MYDRYLPAEALGHASGGGKQRGRPRWPSPAVDPRLSCFTSTSPSHYGRTSQNLRLANDLASLPFAEAPGVKTPLSPASLNAPIATWAALIKVSSVPQYASFAASIDTPPVGLDPNASL